jgi:ankyrin repeat protein
MNLLSPLSVGICLLLGSSSVQACLSSKKRQSNPNEQALIGAKANNMLIVQDALTHNANIYPPGPFDGMPLWWAVLHRNEPMVRMLITHEIKQNGIRRYTEVIDTPLGAAVWDGNTPLIKCILTIIDKGPFRFFQMYRETTPLKTAAVFGDTKIFSLLVAHGLKIPVDEVLLLSRIAGIYEQLSRQQVSSINTLQQLLQALTIKNDRIELAQGLIIRPCRTSRLLMEKLLRISPDSSSLYKALITRMNEYDIDKYRRREIIRSYQPPLPYLFYNHQRLLTGQHSDAVFEWPL